MIESNKTYYECEYCGKVSDKYEEIQECEKICESISTELETIIESCNKLNKLGCTIELREFPYYDNNKLDLAFARRISRDYKLVFKENENLAINLCGIPERKDKVKE